MAREASQFTPPVGLECVHKYKGTLYRMIVVERPDGTIGYKVDDVVYASPTAAAKAIVGQDQFINGRKFWHLENRHTSP